MFHKYNHRNNNGLTPVDLSRSRLRLNLLFLDIIILLVCYK